MLSRRAILLARSETPLLAAELRLQAYIQGSVAAILILVGLLVADARRRIRRRVGFSYRNRLAIASCLVAADVSLWNDGRSRLDILDRCRRAIDGDLIAAIRCEAYVQMIADPVDGIQFP